MVPTFNGVMLSDLHGSDKAMSMFLVTMVFIFLIQNSMETNEQTNAPDDSEATDTEEELDTLSATRQRIRQLLTDYFAL